MNQTAYFIADRALSLAFEAVQKPDTAPTALAWIYRAIGWAKKHTATELEEPLTAHLAYIGANLCAMQKAA